MPGIKELKNKIKSIKSTRKITKAMQMVSAAKMRKSQTSALNSRKYSDLAWELIHSLSGVIPTESSSTETSGGIPYSESMSSLSDSSAQLHSLGMTNLLNSFPSATKTGIIIISTNKGLVGSFNTNLINKLREIERHPSTSLPRQSSEAPLGVTNNSNNSETTIFELLVMGKKVKEAAVRTNRNLIADFTKKDSWMSIEGIYPLAKTVTDLYLTGQYKQILIIYNHFVSTLTQKPTVKQLLPFKKSDDVAQAPQLRQGFVGQAGLLSGKEQATGLHYGSETEYLFEPTPELVLNHLIPRIIESQIYQAVLESDASEHSARMVMMKNATEAAGDLIDDYTLTYNQLRQNKITTELAEITAGKIALE